MNPGRQASAIWLFATMLALAVLLFSPRANSFTPAAIFAGAEHTGISDDLSPAKDFLFAGITDLAPATDGSLYVADAGNRRIVRVRPDGLAETVHAGILDAGGHTVQHLALGPDGTLYYTTWRQVWRLTAGGSTTLVAGTGDDCSLDLKDTSCVDPVWGHTHNCTTEDDEWLCGDGTPAVGAQFGSIYALAVDGQGTVWTGDRTRRWRTISGDGVVRRAAGLTTLFPKAQQPDGPATAVDLRYPWAGTVSVDGSLLMLESFTQGGGGLPFSKVRLRRLGWDGKVTTMVNVADVEHCTQAGYDPGWAPAGDGGFASEACLAAGSDVGVGPDGSVYIHDYKRIRRIDPSGVITTVADPNVWEWGQPHCDGPGAALCYANGAHPLAVDAEGTVYWVNGTYNQRIMRMGAGGLRQDEQVRVPSPDGALVYAFDRDGVHERTDSAVLGTTLRTFHHESDGKLVSITDAFGNEVLLQRSGDALTGVVNAHGDATSFGADGSNLMSSCTDPAAQTTSAGWNAGALMAGTGNAISSSSAQYDTDGALQHVTGPTGISLAITHQVTGNTEQVSLTSGLRTASATATKVDNTTSTIEAIGPSGLQVSSTVHSEDWTTVYPTGMRVEGTVAKHPKFGDQAPYVDSVTVTTPSGLAHRVTARETYEPIDEPERVISTTTVNGRAWSSTLDLSTGVVSGVSPVGRVSQSEINVLGQVMRTLGPNVLPTTYHYDARGRVEYTQQGDRDLHLEYDEHGAVRIVRDHDDPTTVYVAYTNDAIGRPTSIRPAATSHPILLQYDVSSNVTSLTTPRDDEHRMGYVNGALFDFYDAPALGDPPMVDRTRYEYNEHDQLAKIRTPAGQEIWFGYDEPSGRLGHVVEPGRTITLHHDTATGLLQSVDATDGTALGFTYDGELPVFVTSSGVVSGAVSWTYNQDHSLRTESAANRTVVYQYDDDRLVTLAGEMTVHTDPNDGRLTGTTLAGVSDTLGYNAYGEVAHYRLVYGSETTPRYESDYEHDALGRIMAVRETVREADGSVRSTKARRYTYHPRGWLHQVYRLEPGGEETLLEAYTYDRNGNRTNGEAEHDAQDRLNQDSQYTYGYDGNGALSRKSGAELTTYMHDVHGRLVSVASDGEPVVTYRTDALGRRIAKLVDGQVRYKLLYRSGLQPVAMQDGDGNDTARFVYATGRNVPDYMIAFESGGDVVYRIVTDERGSVRMVVRVSDGWVAQYMDYDEWGVVVEDTSEGFQPFGYAGGLYDADTGLVHFGARDYDPRLGRWTSKDPIRFAGGDIGLYNYAGGDPINQIDPSGLYATSLAWLLLNDDVRSFVLETNAKMGFTVVDLLLGGSTANAPEGLTASRENSLRPEETLVRTAAGVVMVVPVARAAVAMVGQGLSRVAARGGGKVFFMDDGVLAPGQLAGTTASGEIYVAHARVFAAEARALGIPFRQLVRRTLRHELVHRFFAVPGLRGRIGMLGYKHSNLLKALEEGIAEGYGARSIGAGLREPFIPGQNISRLGLGLEAGAYFGGIGTAIYLGATQ